MAADVARMERAIREWLSACGLDPAHADLATTPERVRACGPASSWTATTRIRRRSSATVVGEADPDVVVVAGLRFHAMCPHHLFPYRGLAHVAYLPEGKLVGFGRLGKLVDCFTNRLTLAGAHDAPDRRGAHAAPRRARRRLVLEAEQMCLALPGDKHDTSGGHHLPSSAKRPSAPTCARACSPRCRGDERARRQRSRS